MKGLFKLLPLLVTCFLLSALNGAIFVSGAQAATVNVININDSVDKPDGSPIYFDSTTTTWDETNNKLSIALIDFSADEKSVYAYDSLGLTITPEEGFIITKITYYESGESTGTNGITVATGTLTVNGTAYTLGSHLYPSEGATDKWVLGKDIIVNETEDVYVSITNNLFAYGTDAHIFKTEAYLIVETEESANVPLPTGALLLGAGLIGLMNIRRKVTQE